MGYEDRKYTDKTATLKVNFCRKLYNNGNYYVASFFILEFQHGELTLQHQEDVLVANGKITCDLDKDYEYLLTVKEYEDEKYGLSYEICSIVPVIEVDTLDDQITFLRKILTQTQFTNYYDIFGGEGDLLKPLREGDTKSLLKIKGIGLQTVDKLLNKYENNIANASVIIKLAKYGLTDAEINLMIKSGFNESEIVSTLERNPYEFISKVKGLGFKKIDAIALKNGVKEEDLRRIKGFITYAINKRVENGSTKVGLDELEQELDNEFGVDFNIDLAIEALKDMEQNEDLWVSADRSDITTTAIRESEKYVAKRLVDIMRDETKLDYDLGKIKVAEKSQGFEYSEEQRGAIKQLLANKVSVLTALGGSGKTAVVRGALACLKEGYDIRLMALSGKASSVLANASGLEASTIHKFLIDKIREEIVPDVVVIDECSMPDIGLTYKLLQLLPNTVKIIFIGDPNQLPAIGAGNLLFDMLESGVIPTIRLTRIYRQGLRSGIVTESRKITEDKNILEDGYGVTVKGEDKDFIMDIYKEKEDSLDKVMSYYKKLLKKYKPKDIVVLSCVKTRGEACTYNINNKIQEILFKPNEKHIVVGKKDREFKIHVKDIVINGKNNPKCVCDEGTVGIYNGEVGTVISIDETEKTICVNFGKGRECVYINQEQMAHIELGYSYTIHRSQGITIPATIMVLDNTMIMMANKNLIYTGITRAKDICYLVGQKSTLQKGLRTSGIAKRKTFLKEFLEEYGTKLEG